MNSPKAPPSPDTKKEQEKNSDPPPDKQVLFEQFWMAYPRKVGKGSARRAFEKLDLDDDMLSDILRGLEAQIRWRRRAAGMPTKELDRLGIGFIPAWKHPSTWLNGECWSDELPSLTDGLANIGSAQPKNIYCRENSCNQPGTYGGLCAWHYVKANPKMGVWSLEKMAAQLKEIGLEPKEGESTPDWYKRCRQAWLKLVQEVSERDAKRSGSFRKTF